MKNANGVQQPDCAEDRAAIAELATRVTATPEAFAKHLSDLSEYTSDQKIISAVADAVTALRGY